MTNSIFMYWWTRKQEYCYNSMTLKLIKERNLVLGLTQENLMEFLVQCIYLYICCIISLFLKSSTMFYVTITVTMSSGVTDV